ncbi:hypothetical protein L1887_32600 [Cichorium endivia]|nr:hypothetical protein L1887_32600 [Cichorium endivia]
MLQPPELHFNAPSLEKYDHIDQFPIRHHNHDCSPPPLPFTIIKAFNGVTLTNANQGAEVGEQITFLTTVKYKLKSAFNLEHDASIYFSATFVGRLSRLSLSLSSIAGNAGP